MHILAQTAVGKDTLHIIFCWEHHPPETDSACLLLESTSQSLPAGPLTGTQCLVLTSLKNMKFLMHSSHSKAIHHKCSQQLRDHNFLRTTTQLQALTAANEERAIHIHWWQQLGTGLPPVAADLWLALPLASAEVQLSEQSAEIAQVLET